MSVPPDRLHRHKMNDAMMRWVGTWSPTELYVSGDAVAFDTAVYVCILENSHQKPPSPTYWAVLGNARSTYVDDRILDADAATVDFIVPQDFHLLRFSWYAHSDAGEDSFAFLNTNDTYLAPVDDYRWSLSLQNQQGSQGSATDSDIPGTGGGIGYIFGAPSSAGWGTIEIPHYGISGSPFGGPVYSGHGGWSQFAGPTPDTWTVAGYNEAGGPLTTMSVSVVNLTGLVSANFAAGSRFTLILL